MRLFSFLPVRHADRHHGKDLFTKQDGCLVTVDSRNRVEIASEIKYAVSHKAVDVRMPDQLYFWIANHNMRREIGKHAKKSGKTPDTYARPYVSA